jgi:membrane protein
MIFKISDIPSYIQRFWKFITEDVWRIPEWEISKKRSKGYNFLKIIALAVRRFSEDDLRNRASALTYSTLLSIVPLLAVILAIAKGFGFKNIVESQIFNSFAGHQSVTEQILYFVDSYLAQSKNGVFLGLGLIILLYTVYNLIANIENVFNYIWQVKKGRSLYRQITDYFSMFLLAPIFLIVLTGLTIYLTATMKFIESYQLISPFYKVLISLSPVVITIFMFTLIYLFMPNTKVLFRHALYAAIFSGIVFQVFQNLYISGQIWVSKYNAIYGSFAVLPLLLLWLQLSWTVCLLGAEIAYASQNIRSYEFEADSKNISRRYKDFLILIVSTLIVKRFESGLDAYTANDISVNSKIPIRLTKDILFGLIEIGLLIETRSKEGEISYMPAMDINKISLNLLFSKIDFQGSEFFKVDKEIEFKSEWEAIINLRKCFERTSNNILLKDL